MAPAASVLKKAREAAAKLKEKKRKNISSVQVHQRLALQTTTTPHDVVETREGGVTTRDQKRPPPLRTVFIIIVVVVVETPTTLF